MGVETLIAPPHLTLSLSRPNTSLSPPIPSSVNKKSKSPLSKGPIDPWLLNLIDPEYSLD